MFKCGIRCYDKAIILLILTHFFLVATVRSQFLMDLIDTSTAMGRSMLGMHKKFDHLTFVGYMQPQFQHASDTGI